MYDVEYTKKLLENLDVQTSICTKSEKDLRQYLNIDLDKHIYCVEQENALNVLLKSCIQTNEDKLKVNKNLIDKVYRLLKNDLFIKKKDELNNEYIYSSQIDELTFFKFIYDLYSDIEYRKSHNKDSNVSKEIVQSIVPILHHYAQRFVAKEDEELRKDSRQTVFDRKDRLYEVLESIPYIEASIRLKHMYCKNIDFLVDSDIELLRKLYAHEKITKSELKQTSHIQEQFQKASTWAKNQIKDTPIVVKHDKTSHKWFVFTGINLVGSAALYQIDNLTFSGFSLMALINLGAAATSLAGTSDDIQKDLVQTRYELKKHNAYQKVINYLHHNEHDFDQIKDFLSKTKNNKLTQSQLLRNFKLVQQLQNLTLELRQAKQEKNQELKQLYRSKVVDDHYQEFSQNIKEALKYFVNFDDENKDKLMLHMRSSKEFALKVKNFVKSNRELNIRFSSLKTFNELNSAIFGNAAQSYLAEALKQIESDQSKLSMNVHSYSI